MLPPTYCTCLELYDFAHPARGARRRRRAGPDADRAARQVDDDGGYLSIPDRLVALGEDVAARMRA